MTSNSKLPPTAFYTLDLEFTNQSQLLEIGVVLIRGEHLTAHHHSLVRPSQGYIDPYVSKLTGITMDMLGESPTEETAIVNFISSFDNVQQPNIIVWGHDEKIIRKVLRRYEMEHLLERFKFLDMCEFLNPIRFFFPDAPLGPKNSLTSVAHALGCSTEKQKHRAMDDAFVTAKVVLKVMALFGQAFKE